MKPLAQNRAIALSCGWTFEAVSLGPIKIARWWSPEGRIKNLPNYLSDLNAMHEAEKTFANDDCITQKYWQTLYDVANTTRWPYDATAAQRAEAFLRILDLWTDS